MARPKNRTIPKAEEKVSNLLEALKFLSLITTDKGPPNETHVWLGYNWAYASNGAISASCKIEEDINACPHNSTLIEALSKCGQNISFTQIDPSKLSIKSDRFKAIVPCIDQSLAQFNSPDKPIVEISDILKAGFEAVNLLASEDANDLILTSVLIHKQSLISTNRKIVFEYWHGLDLPPDLPIPKSFSQALVKSTKKLAKFGFSQSSVTFYFEDDSWIKSQLYAGTWPDVSKILDRKTNAWPLPPDFFKGLAAVSPFSPDGLIHFGKGVMTSHQEGDVGASYSLDGLPPGLKFSAKQLNLIKPYVEIVDFIAPGPIEGTTCLMFYGKNIRGVVAPHVQSR